jgi:hypothetical protein
MFMNGLSDIVELDYYPFGNARYNEARPCSLLPTLLNLCRLPSFEALDLFWPLSFCCFRHLFWSSDWRFAVPTRGARVSVEQGLASMLRRWLILSLDDTRQAIAQS